MLGDRPECQTAKIGCLEASGRAEDCSQGAEDCSQEQGEGKGEGEESYREGQGEAEGKSASGGGTGSGVARGMLSELWHVAGELWPVAGPVSCGLWQANRRGQVSWWQARMPRRTTIPLLLATGRHPGAAAGADPQRAHQGTEQEDRDLRPQPHEQQTDLHLHPHEQCSQRGLPCRCSVLPDMVGVPSMPSAGVLAVLLL